ncbi:MAG: histidinol-phosphatase [Verrucomicrobiota bacterium]|nr:histidinol-phosphatase [Verrucomicrobiota bacterium]
MDYRALADYHVHTPLCHHASGWPMEFARRAVEIGLGELGFADHNPMREAFDEWRMSLADLPRYLDLVDEARAHFPQLPIRLGLECDYLAEGERWIEELAGRAKWDFLIGSVHYIAPGWDVDNPRWIGRFREQPVGEIWQLYWNAYERCIQTGLFDFVAHPDLPKKFGYRPPGDLRRYYEPSIEALAKAQVAVEINTAGLRKECRELYPARDFLELAHAAGVPLLINSDAHHPAELAADFEAAVALARGAGYTHTVRFRQRKRTLVPLP